ncbi:MAG: class I SAM-dependent methyltransferase [Caldilineaceae bacterium]
MYQTLVRRLYAWACECLYTELAWSYDLVSWLVSLGRWHQWRTFAADYVQGTHVLEIGFGTGELLPYLARRTAMTVGLERSPAMQHQTAQKLRKRRVDIPCVQARAQAMPFAAGAFDTIIATFPAPYIVEPATLQECARLLRQPARAVPNHELAGGRLVIVGLWVALEERWWSRWVLLFYGRPSPQWVEQLSARLAVAGFHPVVNERADGPVRVGVVVAERIDQSAA